MKCEGCKKQLKKSDENYRHYLTNDTHWHEECLIGWWKRKY